MTPTPHHDDPAEGPHGAPTASPAPVPTASPAPAPPRPRRRFVWAHPSGSRGGRGTKLTPLVQQQILSALTAGNYAKIAAGYAGVGESTYYEWKERGEQDKAAGRRTPFAEFAESVKKAENDAEVRAVSLIHQAMPGDWQAAMTYLERKFPERWGRRARVEVTGAGGGPITTVDLSKLSVETLERIFAELDTPESPAGLPVGAVELVDAEVVGAVDAEVLGGT